jgi:histidinol phosphatase-like PHP family hydrolase
VPLKNAELAELLARQSEIESGVLVRAFRRAARNALFWPESATTLIAQNRSLVELSAIGPFIDKRVRRWIENPKSVLGTIPPIRRDFFAMADAKSFLKKKPAWEKLLRGDLQMHTCWSDGSGTVAAMAATARERGYEYIAITDHSKGLKIAGGIGERDLRRQTREIAETNGAIWRSGGRLTVLRSIEMNLNPRGEGDMDPRSLSGLDLVLGSFHSSLRRTDDQTERYLAALRNPHIQILGHPRGRIYNFRLGLKADWPRVFAEATRLDKALEIDCYPDRQDLNVTLLRLARSAGTRVSFGTDAHHPWQLEFIQLGLAAALRARIPAERIINFMSFEQIKRWIARLRERGR